MVSGKQLPPTPSVIQQKQYNTFAYNCHSPVSIQYIDKEERCHFQSDNTKIHKTQNWDILVHPTKLTNSGYWCSIVRSSIQIRCGVWSYIQLIAVPETEVQVHIPASLCQSMIQEKVYRTEEGQEVKLDPTKENVITMTLGGEFHATDTKVNYCQGTDRKVGTGIIENALVLEQLKINIRNTTILSEPGHRLLSDFDWAYLPTNCKVHQNFCYTQKGTYIWDPSDSPKNCIFEYYRDGQFQLVQPNTFLDPHNKIVIRFSDKNDGAVVQCNSQTIMQTLEGLWVTERDPMKIWTWKKLQTPNLHQALEVQINYLIYTFTTKLSSTHQEMETNRCRLQNRLHSDSYEHLEGDFFVRDLGDSLALTQCKQHSVSLKSDSKFCYHDIPLQRGYFLDKETHVIKFNSTSRPCVPKFPLAIIQTLEGEFVSLEPDVHTVTVTKNKSLIGNFIHNNFNSSIDFVDNDEGLATELEWKALAENIQYAGLRSMLQEDLTTSLCLDATRCSSLITGTRPTVSYNPSVLNLPTPKQIEDRLIHEMNLSIWDRFMRFIESKAAIICTIALFVQVMIFVLTLIDFCTSSNEGNILRIFLKLIVRIVLRLTNCCCKYNVLRRLVKKKDNSNSTQVRYTSGNNTIELPPILSSSRRSLRSSRNSVRDTPDNAIEMQNLTDMRGLEDFMD